MSRRSDDAVAADVVEASDERAHRVRAGLRGEQRLRGGEDERRRDANAVGREARDRAQTILEHRHLDDDVVGDLRQLFSVAIDVVGRDREYRCAAPVRA